MAQRDINYKKNIFNIAYDIVNPSKENTILILHGWGSNKEIMKQAFAKQMSDFKHVYVDMPGFGKSTNPIVLVTEDYAQIMKIFLEDIGVEADIIAGHSFGGKVATLLKPKCLVLLSSSGIRVPKELAVRIKIALFKILKPFKLDRLHQLFVSDDAKGMNHEMYETFKNVVNEDFEPNFSHIKGKTLLFWGKSDTATPLWTAEKINSIIKKSKLYPLDGDHYFFLKHSKFISDTIVEYYKEHK
ncbi:MAG: alpha/beta hydrolase [Sulfurovaceae bacterium]|nr:alpha/beta hydrolase [Sulfurovaceae bacterium]MDD5360342.1 alpha/beta hydrolase [Sulfurovaceae bacterium]